METQRLSIVNPFIYLEDNKAYSNRGSILWGYRLTLPEIYSLDKEDYQNLHTMWYKAFKDLPSGTLVHKMDIYLKQKFRFTEKSTNSFLQNATERYFNDREYINHHSLLFFILPHGSIPSGGGIKNPFVKPEKTKQMVERFEKSNMFYSSYVSKAVEYINNSRYLKAEGLTSPEFEYLEKGYFNGFYEDRITDFDLKNSEIGDKKLGVYALSNLNQFGEYVKTSIEDPSISERDWVYHQGFMDSMALKLSCDHIYNQVIYIRDHHQEKKQIEKSKNDFFGSRKFSREYQKDAEKLDQFLDQIAEDEKIRLVYGHNNIIYYASNQDEYEALSGQIPNLFKQVDMMPYYPKGKNKANIISNSFPGFISNLDLDNYYGPIDLQQSLCLFTNVSNYRPDDDGIYFNDRLDNVPIRKDVWDTQRKRIKARNFFIIAPTGEGKSVLFNHVARQFYESGTSVVIVDLGGSYRKLSLLYPDQTIYIRYKEGEPLGLNPFEKDGKKELTAEKAEELANFVFKIWKKDRMPTDGESVALKKIIRTYYQNIPAGHSLPDFYDFIDQYRESLEKKLELSEMLNLEDFLHICSEFVGNGLYSFLFKKTSKPEDRIGDKRFVIFELDEVRENPVLLTIMLHLISETIRRVIWQDRSQKGVVFFDEFAKMLQFPSVLSSAAYFNQTIRKYEGAVGYVLQSPSQLPENEIAQSMIDNTQVLYILQNTKGYDSIIKRFGMREHQKVQLQSIRANFNSTRPYSEFMLVLGKQSNIYRLEIPREVFYAYQSEGKEYEQIMELYQQTGDMQKAIEKYMQ